jgi:hypothetical protein
VSDEVVRLIQDAGHIVKYLSPYSPDFSAIEMTFALLKAWLRRYYRRTMQNERIPYKMTGSGIRKADCLSTFPMKLLYQILVSITPHSALLSAHRLLLSLSVVF